MEYIINYEIAWKEMMNIINNIKQQKIEDDLEAIFICAEHLQSELNKNKINM